jgi:hypothetical protein
MRRVVDDDGEEEEEACEVGVFRSVIGWPASAQKKSTKEREKRKIMSKRE